MKVTVLGSGLVGGAIVRDLAKEPGFELTVVDRSQEALDRACSGIKASRVLADLSAPGTVHKAAASADLVVGAVPGWLGMQALREVIDARRPVVDISFMPEDPLVLDGLAREKGVTAAVDCGVAPGTSNMLIGHAISLLDEVDEVLTMVGGLPVVRRWPYEYGAVFSPSDVLEEYTRPVRQIEGGEVVLRAPLSELELVDFPGVGTLESFVTDGSRTLLKTVKAKFMKEKTLRYPGHAERIRVLLDTGLLSQEPIDVGGVQLRPRDLTAKLLSRVWKLGEGDQDITVMRVIVAGRRGDGRVRHTYDLLDRYDTTTGTTSMARTTGYMCTAVVRLVASGKLTQIGVVPPERLGGESSLCDAVLEHLRHRGIVIREQMGLA